MCELLILLCIFVGLNQATMNWKNSLDKYLTSEPYDNFDVWAEAIQESFTDQFYNNNEEWVLEYDGQCNKWMNKMFYKNQWSDVQPIDVARIIERAHSIYINKQQP